MSWGDCEKPAVFGSNICDFNILYKRHVTFIKLTSKWAYYKQLLYKMQNNKTALIIQIG